jgi:hypothetical protein
MNFAGLKDEDVVEMHVKLLERKKWLMSPAARAYRDKLMRSQIARSYEKTRSNGGEFEFKAMFDVWEEKEMREECKKFDGTNYVNQDYLDWKAKDFHERGLDGAWLNR